MSQAVSIAMKVIRPSMKDDPEEYRMSIGEHLEELRWRLILALIGFVVIFLVCLFFGTEVVAAFVRPLYDTLKRHNINPQIYYSQVGSAFMVYIQMSLISAAALAGPWILYQFWLFVAAGLYRHERKWVTKHLPLSITLLISGMLFVYYVVLPMSLDFFIGASNWFPIPETKSAQIENPPQLMQVPTMKGDPAKPTEGTLWYNQDEGKLKFHIGGQTSVIQFLPLSLVAPHITLDDYIDMVVIMLLVFGLAFQLPLVVMGLLKIGIVEVATMKRARKIVYFVLLILAASITPGDLITATMALMVPLVALYELGLYLGARGLKSEPKEEQEEPAKS